MKTIFTITMLLSLSIGFSQNADELTKNYQNTVEDLLLNKVVLTEISFIRQNAGKASWRKIIYYDDFGRETGSILYDTLGKLISRTEQEYENNLESNVIESRLFNSNDSLIYDFKSDTLGIEKSKYILSAIAPFYGYFKIIRLQTGLINEAKYYQHIKEVERDLHYIREDSTDYVYGIFAFKYTLKQ